MICKQCGQAVMLNPGSDHMPPWCQRCGADIRDALYGENAGATAIPTAVLTATPAFDSRPLPVRDKRRSPSQAESPADLRTHALFVGLGLLVAAVVLVVLKFRA